MSAHTPGPWSVDYQREQVYGSNGSTVVYELNFSKADAQLIAAAPDLLEALTALVLNCDAGSATVGALTDARAAIAKATGGAA